MKSLKSQIAFLEEQVKADAGKPADAASAGAMTPELGLISERISLARPRREALIQQRSAVSERIEWLRRTLASAPGVEQQMHNLQRDREALQASLQDMRSKLDTARVGLRLEEDRNADQIQVVEAPEVPRYPSEPRRSKILLAVLAVAGLAGAGSLYLRDMLDRTIRGTFDLSRALKGQSLVVIPHWNTKKSRFARFARLVSPVFALLIAALPAVPGTLPGSLQKNPAVMADPLPTRLTA